MPLHRNESSGQATMSFKNMDTFVKENNHLSRERVTVFTQLSSDPKIKLLPEFVFKGTGKRPPQVDAPAGIKYQWASKGSYRLEQLLAAIRNLSNNVEGSELLDGDEISEDEDEDDDESDSEANENVLLEKLSGEIEVVTEAERREPNSVNTAGTIISLIGISFCFIYKMNLLQTYNH